MHIKNILSYKFSHFLILAVQKYLMLFMFKVCLLLLVVLPHVIQKIIGHEKLVMINMSVISLIIFHQLLQFRQNRHIVYYKSDVSPNVWTCFLKGRYFGESDNDTILLFCFKQKTQCFLMPLWHFQSSVSTLIILWFFFSLCCWSYLISLF